jgi:hypothetical protein
MIQRYLWLIRLARLESKWLSGESSIALLRRNWVSLCYLPKILRIPSRTASSSTFHSINATMVFRYFWRSTLTLFLKRSHMKSRSLSYITNKNKLCISTKTENMDWLLTINRFFGSLRIQTPIQSKRARNYLSRDLLARRLMMKSRIKLMNNQRMFSLKNALKVSHRLLIVKIQVLRQTFHSQDCQTNIAKSWKETQISVITFRFWLNF